MLVPMIISLWFAYLANKYEKGVIEWAIGGAFMTLILNTALLETALLLFSDSLNGSKEHTIYLVTRLTPSIITMVTMVFMGKILISPKSTETTATSSDDSTENHTAN